MKKHFRIGVISILSFLVLFNMGLSFAYWASVIFTSNNQAGGSIEIGLWVPTGFFGVSQDGAGDLITLDQIGTTGYPLSGNYIMMSDINWNHNTFAPIGGTSNAFTGEFYGNGFKISNIVINTNQQFLGLFAQNNGLISDVSMDNIQISRSATANDYRAGGLAGINQGTIINSYASGFINIAVSRSVTGWFSQANATVYGGGLVGINSGSILTSHADVNVTISANASAGIFGTANATAYGGGLAGEHTSLSVIDTYATGNVTVSATRSGTFGSANSYAGGLIGQSTVVNGVNNSFAAGNVTISAGNINIGGLVGNGSANQSYRRDGQLINGISNGGNSIGTITTLDNLQLESWVNTNLLWTSDKWAFGSNSFPLLKRNKY